MYTKKIHLSKELKLIIDLLFHDKINKKILANINYEKIIKILSSQLIIPAFYHKIIENNYGKLFDREFLLYIKKIFLLNKERNIELTKELKDIRDYINEKNIEFTFLKGSWLIDKKKINEAGVRMQIDIDLIPKKKENCTKIQELLIDKGYTECHPKFKKRKTRHLPRLIKEDKFPIEVHKELIRFNKRNQFRFDKFHDALEKNSKKTMISLIILNHQLNDHGALFGNLNIRALYDIKIIDNFNKKNIDIENNYIKKFFMISNMYGISNLSISIGLFDKIYILRHYLIANFKAIRLLNWLVCSLLINIKLKRQQLTEIIENIDYRKWILKKIISK